MPPKLQVDESLAFLFMCIDASACKIDFRLVGDAMDLQPAAARMRYARLKKAVEGGDFRGAILMHPPPTSAQLAAIANPESRRLAAVPRANRVTKNRDTARVQHTSPFNPQLSHESLTAAYMDEAEEEEAEEEEIDEDVAGKEGTMSMHKTSTIAQHQPKRKASVELGDDCTHDLFYPDTSRATRKTKQIKRSESDIESDPSESDDENDSDYTPNSITRQQRRPQRIRARSRVSSSSNDVTNTNSSPASRITKPSIPLTNNAEEQAQRSQKVRSFEDFSQAMHESYPARYSARNSLDRFSQSPSLVALPQQRQSHSPARRFTRTANEAPYAVGVVSGAPQPTQEDISFAAATGQSPMRVVRATHNPFDKSFDRGVLAAPAPNSHFVASSSPNFLRGAPQPFYTQTRHMPQYEALSDHQRENTTVSRHHPASVFDGFRPPAVSRFNTPSSITKRGGSTYTPRGQPFVVQRRESQVEDEVLDPLLRSSSPISCNYSSPGSRAHSSYLPPPRQVQQQAQVTTSNEPSQIKHEAPAESPRTQSQASLHSGHTSTTDHQPVQTCKDTVQVDAHDGANGDATADPKSSTKKSPDQCVDEVGATDQDNQHEGDET